MNRGDAVWAAREWVNREGADMPGFCGSYLSGSVLETPDDAAWSNTSDVDVVVVLRKPSESPGKFTYQGALLEVTCIDRAAFDSLDHILTTHYLAYALQANGILSDPEGWLAPLHRAVAEQFASPYWIRRRCDGFIATIRKSAAAFDPSAPYPERVNSWLFPTGISTFPIISAGLKNCTVKKRYSQARRVLSQYRLEEFCPRLLAPLIGDAFDAACLPMHLQELIATYDLASASFGPSKAYRFRADITPQARNISIGGIEELLASAYPQDAVFWMGATFARCQIILHMDDAEKASLRLPVFRRFMADLGLRDDDDFKCRFDSLLVFLPDIQKVCESIPQTRA